MAKQQTDNVVVEEHVTHCPADYVIILENKLDKFNQLTKESYLSRTEIIRNLLAAKLELSWYPSADNRYVIIRVAGNQKRLIEEAQRREMMMRRQDAYKEEYEPANETFVEFRARQRAEYFNPFQSHGVRRFTSLERHRLVFHIILAKHDENGAYLPAHASEIFEIFPMHTEDELEQLKLKWYGPDAPLYGGAEREIRDYFGERVALYFAFLKFYTRMLGYLAVGGVLTTVAQLVQGNDSLATPIFALYCSLWSCLLGVYWTRQENQLKSQWNVEDFEESEKPRPEYTGTLVTNIQTGYPEIQDQSSTTVCRRACTGIFAFVATMIVTMIAMAPTVMRDSLLGDSYVSVIIASCATYVIVEIVNRLVKRMALHMANAENHRTDTEHTDSLIAKTFLMQFCPTFGALFFVAYVQDYLTVFGHQIKCSQDNCWSTLCIMLTTQFILHMSIGNALELYYVRSHPRFNCFKCMRTACKSCGTAMRRCCGALVRCYQGLPDPLPEHRPLVPPGAESAGPHFRTPEETDMQWKSPYPGPLSDYNELVLQYGFVILFAPAFPLGAVLAWMANILEYRLDAHKLCVLYRRPLYECAEDIGLWFQMIQIVSTVAVVTNSIIIAYTSSALDSIDAFEFGHSRHLAKLCIAVGIEHLVFFFQFMISSTINPLTDHVLEEKKKRLWVETQEEVALIKDVSDPEAPYVVRNKMANAPEEYEYHVDEV